MTLSQVVRERLAEGGPFRDNVHEIVATDNNLTLKCQVAATDSFSCALTQIELQEMANSPFTNEQLAKWTERICSKVVYLLEPLKTIEVDQISHVALVRSQAPKNKDHAIAYYEMLAHGDHHATLSRYRFDTDSHRRDKVAFVLTNDQLEVLVDDLVAATTGLTRN